MLRWQFAKLAASIVTAVRFGRAESGAKLARWVMELEVRTWTCQEVEVVWQVGYKMGSRWAEEGPGGPKVAPKGLPETRPL